MVDLPGNGARRVRLSHQATMGFRIRRRQTEAAQPNTAKYTLLPEERQSLVFQLFRLCSFLDNRFFLGSRVVLPDRTTRPLHIDDLAMPVGQADVG